MSEYSVYDIPYAFCKFQRFSSHKKNTKKYSMPRVNSSHGFFGQRLAIPCRLHYKRRISPDFIINTAQDQVASRANTDKIIFPFPFTLNGI